MKVGTTSLFHRLLKCILSNSTVINSDLYYDKTVGGVGEPHQPRSPPGGKSTAKKARNLEDRVREYTGYIQVGIGKYTG